MVQHTPEEIVRRATAAFNAGRRDEARQLCEEGLIRAPGEPMLSHLLAAVLFSKGEIRAARGHVETSLSKRSDNAAAHLLAARIARTAGDFDAALSHLDRATAIAPQREAFLEKARTLDQAISFHGGEATGIAQGYFTLTAKERRQVEAFLKSLTAPLSEELVARSN